MKGILLAGGTGTRLAPMTRTVNKHLLPIYDEPMVFFPIRTLVSSGITDILVISGPEHLGSITQMLGGGKDLGARFTYRVQEQPLGIAHAVSLAEDFAAGESVAVILGDSIFEDSFAKDVASFTAGARIFLKKVPDPQRFGVPTLDGTTVIRITEKPKKPDTSYAQTGLYLYDNTVFDVIRTLTPSKRGEYEITDVNNAYIKKNACHAAFLRGYWTDAGTVESLFRASELVRKKRNA